MQQSKGVIRFLSIESILLLSLYRNQLFQSLCLCFLWGKRFLFLRLRLTLFCRTYCRCSATVIGLGRRRIVCGFVTYCWTTGRKASSGIIIWLAAGIMKGENTGILILGAWLMGEGVDTSVFGLGVGSTS